MKKSLLVISIIVLLSSINIFSQTSVDSLKNDLTDYITKLMKKKKAVGLSIAIVDNQDIIWSEGFGYADIENNLKATDKTIYRVGSVSKVITATSVMQLSEKNMINIDNPITDYIPEFQIKLRYTEPITTRSVLTHHSGLPSDIFIDFFCDEQIPFQTVVDYLNEEYTCSEPNSVMSYSNPGFSLLGYLVEKVSKETFFAYTQNYIFTLLEMNNSSFELTPEMQKKYAKAYEGKDLITEPYIRDIPAGMLHSNVLDMSNFMKMIFNEGKYNNQQIINQETLNEMFTVQNEDCFLDGNEHIGLCWFVDEKQTKNSGEIKIVEHGGDTYVYHAKIMMIPELKIGVIVMTNSTKGGAVRGKITDKAIELSLKYLKGIEYKTEGEKENQKIKKNKDFSAEDLKNNQGDYILGTAYLHFDEKKNKLVGIQNNIKLNLIPNSAGNYSIKVSLLGGLVKIPVKGQQLFFEEIENKTYIGAILNQNDTVYPGIKFAKLEISDLWKNRIGKYEIVDNKPSEFGMKDFEIIEKEGVLMIKLKALKSQNIEMVILPISDSEAIVGGIGRQTGGTVTFKDEILYFSGFKMKKIEETSK